MEASDIRNLQEAYMEVYQELDEGEKPEPYGRMMKKSDELASTDDKAKQKRAAKIYTAANAPKGPKIKIKVKEQVDLYDLILSHLIDEGYTNSIEGAEVILENMSEGWIESIMEAFVDPETGKTPSGRSPVENVSYHPKKSVRRKAMGAFAYQMGKEYGGKWKAKTKDPTRDS